MSIADTLKRSGAPHPGTEVERPGGRRGAGVAGRARSVSLRDVAKIADVSVATVSMVLNENPRISRATQLRVRQVMEETGYRPNRLAQSLSGRYTNVLAVMLP